MFYGWYGYPMAHAFLCAGKDVSNAKRVPGCLGYILIRLPSYVSQWRFGLVQPPPTLKFVCFSSLWHVIAGFFDFILDGIIAIQQANQYGNWYCVDMVSTMVFSETFNGALDHTRDFHKWDPCWGDQPIQMHGRFEVFPLNNALFGR